MRVRSSATPASSHLPLHTCLFTPARFLHTYLFTLACRCSSRSSPPPRRTRRRERRATTTAAEGPGTASGPRRARLFFPVSRCNEVLCVGDQAGPWTAPSPPSRLPRRREARPSRREGSPSSSTPRTRQSCRRRCSRQAALIGHLEPSMRSSSAGVAAVPAVGAAAAVAAAARRHRRASAVSGCLSARTRLIRLRG